MDEGQKINEIHETLSFLKVVVVGIDGNGGLQADVKSLISFRDKGVGAFAAIALFATLIVLGLRAWVMSLFNTVGK